MTFEQLQHKVPRAIPSEWHQHKNGGGWVNDIPNLEQTISIAIDKINAGTICHGVLTYDGKFFGLCGLLKSIDRSQDWYSIVPIRMHGEGTNRMGGYLWSKDEKGWKQRLQFLQSWLKEIQL